MERYILFKFSQYYPCGGWSDFSGSYETEELAREAWDNSPGDYGQIVDSHAGAIVRNLYY